MQRTLLPSFDLARRFGAAPLVVSLVFAGTLTGAFGGRARAQSAAFPPAAAQPVLPATGAQKPTSPVVESLMGDKAPILEVRKSQRQSHRRHEVRSRHRHVARPVPDIVERPALAGVALLQPLPRPGEPPHVTVPLPAYPLDSLVTAATMPAPPVVCHPTRREPGLPDPHLYRERTLVCEADNP